ncbi:hypothetical protein HY572_04435 [Candidatus Micrarchaeota archaeon]|nr:hypothetical protein [Candidatus Micrarchaeota archaeon]
METIVVVTTRIDYTGPVAPTIDIVVQRFSDRQTVANKFNVPYFADAEYKRQYSERGPPAKQVNLQVTPGKYFVITTVAYQQDDERKILGTNNQVVTVKGAPPKPQPAPPAIRGRGACVGDLNLLSTGHVITHRGYEPRLYDSNNPKTWPYRGIVDVTLEHRSGQCFVTQCPTSSQEPGWRKMTEAKDIVRDGQFQEKVKKLARQFGGSDAYIVPAIAQAFNGFQSCQSPQEVCCTNPGAYAATPETVRNNDPAIAQLEKQCQKIPEAQCRSTGQGGALGINFCKWVDGRGCTVNDQYLDLQALSR